MNEIVKEEISTIEELADLIIQAMMPFILISIGIKFGRFISQQCLDGKVILPE